METTVEIYNPLTGLTCDIAGVNLTLINHAQIGLTVCGGTEGNTTAAHNCSKLNKDGTLEMIQDLVLSQTFDSPALSWESSEGFVVCGKETCDLVKSDNTVVEDYITFWPQPE